MRLSARAERVEVFDSAVTAGACFAVGGSFTSAGNGQFVCVTGINFTEAENWEIGNFGIYRKTSSGAAPDFDVAPDLFGAGVYPNINTETTGADAVAATVLCSDLPPAAALRWAWRRDQFGPCAFDSEYNTFLCSARGIANDNNEFTNSTGHILPDDAIVKDVFCPT